MNIPTIKLLISSSSAKTPLVFSAINAVKKVSAASEVIAGDINPNAVTQYVADKFWVMPETIQENFEIISKYCQVMGINFVLPTRDGELLFWAENASKFKSVGVHVIVSPVEGVELLMDKLMFSKKCLQMGIPAIESFLRPDCQSGKSWVVKERFGSGSKSLGLNLSKTEAIKRAKKLLHPIFQPYVVGLEISVDAYLNADNSIKGLALRYREMVNNGESQVTRTFRDSNLETRFKSILEMLGLRGPIVLQALIDPKGNIHIIECNARFGGASTAGIAVGVDSIYWAILDGLGASLIDYPFLRSSVEVKQVRIKSDIYVIDSSI